MLRRMFAYLCASTSAFFFYAYYERHFRWKECFNDLGRCYDSETNTVYLEQAGIVWMTLALIFLLMAVVLFWKRRKNQ
ncbi:MAG: hypothetical protein L3J13_08835 [Devosiaceae bacterium]|nr:hypothetical protein [Devosiaceae bacterium]